MSDPFVGEIRMFGCNFAPKGWATCNGQLMAIQQNTALFSLLGTYYGGNGQTTFALPDLQGMAPVHFGQGAGLSDYFLGQTGGATTVTLPTTEMPFHTHTAQARHAQGDTDLPANDIWAEGHTGKSTLKMYSPDVPVSRVTMGANATNVTGSSLPHNNMPPYLVINFCIATSGIFPSRG